MSAAGPVVHIAIPCRDLGEAVAFYGDLLGCRIGRRHDDHVLVDFWGHQLVCHLSPDRVDPEPRMYPRHFGVAFRTHDEWKGLLERMRASNAPFFADPFVRFGEEPPEHDTFFLIDPGNNVLEFKHYKDEAQMF